VRDKVVILYILAVLLQLPFYYQSGKTPISFDLTIKEAERALLRPGLTGSEQDRVEDLLRSAEDLLRESHDKTSRWARVELDRGVLWAKKGKMRESLEHLELSYQLFLEKHGPDSFHVAAVDLRIAELEFAQSQFPKAHLRFERSVPVVRDYLGHRAAFPLRMAFRQVNCLIALQRLEEAASLARPMLQDLLTVAAEQDLGFLQRTGSALDILSLKGLLPQPPSAQRSWKAALVAVKNGSNEESRGQP
jgi:hypothetical protein